MNYQVIAAGDSYNDTSMLSAASAGILFRPPETSSRVSSIPCAMDYPELIDAIESAATDLGELWN